MINSAASFSIALKFGTEFNHVTPDVSQMFKVKWSKVTVTAWKHLLIAKLLVSRESHLNVSSQLSKYALQPYDTAMYLSFLSSNFTIANRIGVMSEF